MSPPDPVFQAPWHAQLFALTVALNEAGHFVWSEWTEAFGRSLALRGLHHELDGGDDYFEAWLDTLEAMISTLGIAEKEEISKLTQAWRDAYLVTPHGQPVSLGA